MKDYNKEIEELLNPMKKFNAEMEALLNPTKSLMDSIKPIELPTFGSFKAIEPIALPPIGISIPSYTSPLEELQKKMEYDLNPLKKLHDEIDYIFNPFKKIQGEMDLILNPFKELEKTLNPIKSAMESLTLLNNSIGESNLVELNKALKILDISSFKVEKSTQKELEEQIELLTSEDKKTLDDIIDTFKHIFPDISYLVESFSKKRYVTFVIYFMCVILPFIYSTYRNYFQSITSDSYYKINRNKVRVRTEPSTKNNSIIIMKLNKNVFVEKIDSHKNWLKIEFEDEGGQEIEGWVRRDMLTKIENEYRTKCL